MSFKNYYIHDSCRGIYNRQNVKRMTDRNRKFFKDFSIYAVGNLGSKLITFLMVPLYTYFVTDPADFGQYDLCLTFCMMAMPLATLQLREGSFRFLIGSDTNAHEIHSKVVSFVYRSIIGTNSLILLLAAIVSTLSDFPYTWQTTALLMSMSIYEIQSQIIRGLGDNKTFVIMGITTSFGIGVLSIVFVAFMGMGINGIFLSNILSRLFSMLVGELRKPTIAPFLSDWSIDKHIVKEILHFSLPLIPTAICWWITTSSNRYFLNYFCDSDTVGIYAVASKFSSIVLTLSIIFYQTWQETAITQYSSPDKDKFFSKIFNTYIIVLCTLLIGYTFLVKVCYGWLVGPNYQDSSKYVYLLGIGAILYAISAFFELGYQCSKETNRSIWSVMLTMCANIALNFLLVPRFGIYGAVFTSIVSYLLLISYRWIETCSRYYRIVINKHCIIPLALVFLCAVPYSFTNSIVVNILVPISAMAIIFVCVPRDVTRRVIKRFSMSRR